MPPRCKRYTEEKIISIPIEHEAGASVPDLARRHSVAENTIYRWKSKFGGMEVSEAKRLREPEEENRKLKHLLPDKIVCDNGPERISSMNDTRQTTCPANKVGESPRNYLREGNGRALGWPHANSVSHPCMKNWGRDSTDRYYEVR